MFSVEQVAAQVENVESVSVNLALNRAVIRLKSNAQTHLAKTDVITAIERSGFGAKEKHGKPVLFDEAKLELRKQGKKVSPALLLELPTVS